MRGTLSEMADGVQARLCMRDEQGFDETLQGYRAWFRH